MSIPDINFLQCLKMLLAVSIFLFTVGRICDVLPKILPYFFVGRGGGLVSDVEWVDWGVETGASVRQKSSDYTFLQELAMLPNIGQNIL